MTFHKPYDFRVLLDIINESSEDNKIITGADMLASPPNKKKEEEPLEEGGGDEIEDNDNDVEISTVSFEQLSDAINRAAEISPVARLQSLKLVKHLVKGVKDTDPDGDGIKLFGFILNIINETLDGKKYLDKISSLVNHFEGDIESFDENIFPHIVVDLMLLCADIKHRTKK
jgi:hypothetical protein